MTAEPVMSDQPEPHASAAELPTAHSTTADPPTAELPTAELLSAEMSTADSPTAETPAARPILPRISRRQALKAGAVALPGLLGGAVLYDRLVALAGPPTGNVDPILAEYDASAHRWGFVVDSASCIGCGLCVVACKNENNVPLDDEHTRTWVERHVVAADGSVTVDSPEAGIRGFRPASAEASPSAQAATASGSPSAQATAGSIVQPTPSPTAEPSAASPAQVRLTQFVPRLCMQCEESPCTVVCPVGATYRTADGVILVDEQRCIGCGYCILACPYGARYLVPAGPRTPAGVAGVADKCTFCYHRITRGRDPACVEVCPVGARRFGDLNDPASAVSVILREQPTRVMRPALGTRPRVHYLGLEGEVDA